MKSEKSRGYESEPPLLVAQFDLGSRIIDQTIVNMEMGVLGLELYFLAPQAKEPASHFPINWNSLE